MGVIVHVHWRLDAGLRVLPLLPDPHCEPRLHCGNGAAPQCPALCPGGLDHSAGVRLSVCLATPQLTVSGWLSDRAGQRGIYVMAFSALAIVGFVMCIATANAAVGYAGVCE